MLSATCDQTRPSTPLVEEGWVWALKAQNPLTEFHVDSTESVSWSYNKTPRAAVGWLVLAPGLSLLVYKTGTGLERWQ